MVYERTACTHKDQPVISDRDANEDITMDRLDQGAVSMNEEIKKQQRCQSLSTASTAFDSFSSKGTESNTDVSKNIDDVSSCQGQRCDESWSSSSTQISEQGKWRSCDIEATPPPKWIRLSSMESEYNYTPLVQQQMQQSTRSKTKTDNEVMVLFGCDISHLSPSIQFFLCCSGVFSFTILYGYLQELLSVHIAGRKYALFLATCQFAGYALWSLALTKLRRRSARSEEKTGCDQKTTRVTQTVPWKVYIGLSILRALDLGMTNLAMQFVNYPAKTLIRSSRVVFTMLIGVLLGWKKYKIRDYVNVSFLMIGLAIFLHADSKSSAFFHPLGVLFLVVSLISDGVLQNGSELVMNKYSVGHDEFLFRLTSIAFVTMAIAAHFNGDLLTGMNAFFLSAGSVPEIESSDISDTTWTVPRKIAVLVLFCTSGLFGSSCAAAMTKRFGALTMAITSTTRKSLTLFLSYALFPNHCTYEHVIGMVTFLSALFSKAVIAASTGRTNHPHNPCKHHASDLDDALESLEKKEDDAHFELVPISANDGVKTWIYDIVPNKSAVNCRRPFEAIT